MQWSVEPLWQGETCILLGGGPSLARTKWELLKGHKVIAVNFAFRAYPQADMLYFCDFVPFYQQIKKNYEFRHFRGMKVSTAPQLVDAPDIYVLKRGEAQGLSLDPTTLNLGANSGHQALNLAVLMGASRIVLLGFDMQPHGNRLHFDNDHITGPQPGTFEIWRTAMISTVPILDALGVHVINCTPGSALTCFQQMSLQDALESCP